jgi:acetyltransferase-like isoleucine patch superfamily enzyme
MINTTELKKRINKSAFLKKITFRLLIPNKQARPRAWVKWIIMPFFTTRGKHSTVCRNTRMDLFPFNTFSLGDNSTIEDFCTVNNGVGRVAIGNNVRIGIGSVLIGPVNIGDDVRLAQNVVISGLNHNYTDVSQPIATQGVNTEQVYIGDETWIGANSVILSGVFIGKHCVVAAGSVVTKNIPSYTVVAGNPARVMKKYNSTNDTWERTNS